MLEDLKVLIVEDSESDAELLVRNLHSSGYNVDYKIVESEEEMRMALIAEQFQIIYSDYRMPSFTAAVALDVLKEISPETPFIVISGSIGEVTAVDMMKSGADDYLLKGNLTKLGQLTRRALIEAKNRKELRAAEEKLVASAKMSALGEMASVIAHEINNPLMVITTKVSTILKQVEAGQLGNDDANEILKANLMKISKNAHRIAKIIKSVKTISRNAENDPMEECGIKGIIEDAIELCNEKFIDSGVDLRLDLDISDQVYTMGRATQLTQVILNVLTNAFDAVSSNSDKWVSVKVSETHSEIKIQITDSGSGIPDQVLNKMMEPFFTTKGAGSGTGLGLSISKTIIEGHKGQFYYDKNFANTTFVIKLPLMAMENDFKIAA